MEIIEEFNHVMETIDDKENEDITKIYQEINTLYGIIKANPNREKYIYKGPIFISLIIEPNTNISDEEIIEQFKDWPLVLISEFHAIMFAKMQKRERLSSSKDECKICVLQGYTNEGINITGLLNDFPDRKCSVSYVETMRKSNIVVLLKPNSSSDLHIHIREK